MTLHRFQLEAVFCFNIFVILNLNVAGYNLNHGCLVAF